MSFSPYTAQADSILLGMNDYLQGFTVHHSDLMYNYYKEKVFTMTYDQILDRIANLYKINRIFFDQNKLNSALTILHKQYKEYERFYMQQRDAEADVSRVPVEEIEKIILNLERYTATFMRHLIDLKNGFNLFLVVQAQQEFFKTYKRYPVENISMQQVAEQKPNPPPAAEATTELTMNITNMPDGMPHENIPKMTPDEFMGHLHAIRQMANNYFDTNLKPNTKYQLEMKLIFPQS